MYSIEELTERLQRKFNTKDVVGVIGVIESNAKTQSEEITICDSLEKAKSEALSLWCHLTKEEQEYINISVCYLSGEIDEEGNVINTFYEDENGDIDDTIYEEFEWRWEVKNLDYEELKKYIFDTIDSKYNAELLLNNCLNDMGENGSNVGTVEFVDDEIFEITVNNVVIDNWEEGIKTTYDVVRIA